MTEIGNNDGPPFKARLEEIVRELHELAKATSQLAASAGDDQSPNLPTKGNSAKRSQKAHLKAAQLTYALRRSRAKLFKDDSLFGEPAWDILLDLYIADLKEIKLSITDACIGSAVPSTTALRWITILQQADLLTRQGDTRDARRAYLSLTERGYGLMHEFFNHAINSLEN